MRPLRFFRRHAHDVRLAALAAAVVLTLMSSGAIAKNVRGVGPAPAIAVEDAEAQGALIGDLVFHADLLSALDNLCPIGGSAPADWHSALRPLLEEALTP